jgi:hypothetical protein
MATWVEKSLQAVQASIEAQMLRNFVISLDSCSIFQYTFAL